jgi:VanZ family protein
MVKRQLTDNEVDGLSDEEIEEYSRRAHQAAYISMALKIAICFMAVVALYEGETMWVFAGLFALAFTFVPMFLRRNYKISIPWVLELLMFLALFLHVIGGVLDLYDRYPNWDTMTHFFSTFMLGVVSLTIIYTMHVYWDGLTMDLRAMMVITVFVGAFLGVVWELMEWTVDLIFGTEEQLGLDDTMMDLVMDLIGACLASLIGYRWIMDGTLRFMTADLGDALYERLYKKVDPRIPATSPSKGGKGG